MVRVGKRAGKSHWPLSPALVIGILRFSLVFFVVCFDEGGSWRRRLMAGGMTPLERWVPLGVERMR